MFPRKLVYGVWLIVYSLIIIFFLSLPSTIYHLPLTTYADEVEDLQRQINELTKARELSEAATKPLEGQLKALQTQLAQIQVSLKALSNKIVQKEEDLEIRSEKIAEQQELLDQRIRSYYIRSYLTSPFVVILSSNASAGIFRELSYRLAATKEDQKIIISITDEVSDLIQQKTKLQSDKVKLASLQIEVDRNSQFLGGEIEKAQAYQKDLTGKIAELSAKQQSILAAKSGTFTTTVGDVPLADDPNARPDFSPGFSPAFAAFSFGAYTHRNGMSQYGAKGRAEAGQSAEDILKAYYPGASLKKDFSGMPTINVSGFGSMSLEDEYMKRIYEMPNSFPKEALKAQAVAARSYAVRSGGTICPTESCQVYKPSNKGGAWEEAVNETRGWILEGGSNAQYSSTTGGFGNNSGWDTKCGSRNCWTGDAYEKLAGSPWFYKGWYKDRSGDGCGRSHPWLSSEEMADILNAWVVLIDKGQSDDRVTPQGGCWGGNPYSVSELSSKAQSLGRSFSSVSSASVVYSDGGSTANVTFSTNEGSVTINGADFKKAFNLRAPGNISIKSPLFNIEKK